MLNTTNLTRAQKKCLKELRKIMSTKFEGTLEPLENHLDLIEKEWNKLEKETLAFGGNKNGNKR